MINKEYYGLSIFQKKGFVKAIRLMQQYKTFINQSIELERLEKIRYRELKEKNGSVS